MYARAIWNYIADVNLFNLPVTLFIALLAGLTWGAITFSTLGLLCGVLSYNYFKNREYYGYYNLGFTRWQLIKWVFIFNIPFTGFTLLIVLILF